MSIPDDRKYTETHEWFSVEDNLVTVGITQHAADELTDITYVELPAVGASIAEGAALGEVESVKATSEIFTAIGGKIAEINEALADQPELINDDAFGDGWLVRIQADSLAPLADLMSAQDYESHIHSAA
jgi:glycine cleavage system H protein